MQVHYNSPKPARVQALAYTQGSDIYVGPGQEKYLAHEAWHVVQQKRGGVQPTMHLNGVAINDEEELEQEADLMGNEVLQGGRGPEPMQRLSRRQPPAFPVVQRQLTYDALNGYYYDTRDPTRQQHFTKVGLFGGLTGNYVDQHAYTYAYDDVTRQYQVTGGAANQYWDTVNHQQYTKLLGGTGNILHIYTLQPVNTWTNRYYYLGNLYQQVPMQRVRWIDNQGRFVEAPAAGSPRVLTNDGQHVQKNYLLSKDADRHFVLPIKARQHFFSPNRPTFVPGLPNLFGGNLDPQDASPNAAATREAGEETDFAYTTVNVGPQLGAPVNQGGNQLNFHAGTVRTTAAGE
ncbi:MAG: eCIS core domain-containing protein, partial [Candidatus Dormibacteraceae bacterium]